MTVIELNRDNLIHNILEIKKIIGLAKLAVVVKSNAYGHGILEISKLIDNIKTIEYLNVASLSEAILVRSAKINKKILVLSYIDIPYKEAILNNIECVVHNYNDLYGFIEASTNLRKPISVHIKVDTGMGRLGFKPSQVRDVIGIILKYKNIVLTGIFTHLSDTQNPDQQFSYQQLAFFNKIIEELKAIGIIIPIVHALSSSGLSIGVAGHYDLLRAGALIYGVWKSDIHKKLVLKNHPHLNLKPVLTLKTKIIEIKNLEIGNSIGYDRTVILKRESKIALLPIGYSDGIPRQLSNKGLVIIQNNGQELLAPIIGIISMNLIAIDITDLKNSIININDTVVIISDNSNILAQKVAHKAGIIPNELLCSLNKNISRIIV